MRSIAMFVAVALLGAAWVARATEPCDATTMYRLSATSANANGAATTATGEYSISVLRLSDTIDEVSGVLFDPDTGTRMVVLQVAP